jgi:hypothetical protein
MTTASQSTRRKLSLLQLAEELGNVSKACKLMGYHLDRLACRGLWSAEGPWCYARRMTSGSREEKLDRVTRAIRVARDAYSEHAGTCRTCAHCRRPPNAASVAVSKRAGPNWKC